MTGGSRDRDVLERLEKVEEQQKKFDALLNKGKGFWLGVSLILSAIGVALLAAWEVLKHWRGVVGS